MPPTHVLNDRTREIIERAPLRIQCINSQVSLTTINYIDFALPHTIFNLKLVDVVVARVQSQVILRSYSYLILIASYFIQFGFSVDSKMVLPRI